MNPIKLFLAGVVGSTTAIAAPSYAVTLNFGTTDVRGMNAIAAGSPVGSNTFSDFGVTLSVAPNLGFDGPLRLFDSNCDPMGGCGNDADLSTGPLFGTPSQGNVLIIQNFTDPQPNDTSFGGTITFDFSTDVIIRSFALIGIDSTDTMGSIVTSLGGGGVDSLMGLGSQAPVNPLFPNNNSLRIYDFFSDIAFVDQLILTLPSEGAVAFVEFDTGFVLIPEPLTVVGSAIALGIGYALKRKRGD